VIEIRPIVQAVGPDNPSKQISVNNWNLGHALTASPNVLIGTDGAGVEKEFTIGMGPGQIPDGGLIATALDGKVSVSGDVMTGTLEVSNAVTVKAPGGVNGNYWLVNESGTRQGVFYWERASDTVRLRAIMPDGVTLASEIILSPTQFTFQLGALQPLVVDAAGATVTGALTTTGRIDAGGIITTGGANAGMYLNDRDGTGQIVLYDNGDVFRVYINGGDRFTVNATGGGTFQGPVTLPTEAYGPSWNGKSEAPTKDALYDKIEALAAPSILWGNITGTLSNQTDLQTALNAKANLAGGAAFTGVITVPDDPYAAGWDGSTVIPTKNAIYDKIESVIASIPAAPSTVVSDAVYDATWNGTGAIAPSKNAVYDQMELRYAKTGGALSGAVSISMAAPSITLNPVSGISTIDVRGTASTNDGLSLRASGSTVTFAADTTLWRNRAASVTFGTLNSTNLTMTVPIVVPDVAYAPAWDGDFSVPTKNAVYDKINSMGAGGAVDDTPYGASWDGVTTIAPSKNAVYDKIEALSVGGGGVTTFNTRSGAVVLTAADVSAAGANAFATAGLLNPQAGILSTGTYMDRWQNGGINVPAGATGGGLEIIGNFATSFSVIQAYNQTSAAYYPLQVGASQIVFQINAANVATFDAAGVAIATGKVLTVPDDAYAPGWNGSTAVPTKNAVYDKIEAVIATIPAATTSIVGITGTLAQFNTAITDADIMPTAGGTLTGALYSNAASGVIRTYGFLTAGAYAADISLQADNVTLKSNVATKHRFDINGAEIFSVVAAGASVTGNITATGTITSSGAPLATVSQLANYLPLTGGTLSGGITVPTVTIDGASGLMRFNPRSGTGNLTQVYSPSTGELRFNIANVGDIFTMTNASLAINAVAGTARYLQFAVGGVNKAYVALGGNDVSLYYNAPTDHVFRINAVPYLTVNATTLNFVGTTLWVNADKMYIQHNGTNGYIRTAPSVGGDLYLGAQGASTLQLIAGGAAAFSGSVAISTTLAVTGTSAFNGNITLSRNYPNIFIDSTTTDGSGNERSAIQFRNHELDGWIVYSKGEMAAPEFVWRAIIAGATPGSEVVRFTTTGDIICTGAIYAASNKRAYQQATAMAGAEIYMSTSAPSGGADGDIWLQYV